MPSYYYHLVFTILLTLKKLSSHDYEGPSLNDIRGPCPSLNVAANHGYINRSGITTFNELVQMQQELFNFGEDVTISLTALGIALDGDIETEKLSMERTSSDVEGVFGIADGLDKHGEHGKVMHH